MGAILLATIAACVFVAPVWFGAKYRSWRLGLDLVGGAHLVYEVDMSKIGAGDRSSVLSGLRDVMENRVNAFGVSEPQVFAAQEGDSRRIIVELAGIRNTKEAIQQIGRTALLDFREVEGEGENAKLLETGLTGRHLKSAEVVFNQTTSKPEISVDFDSEGARLFEEITGRNIGKQLPILLDGAILSSPVVREKISGGKAVISGQFDNQEAIRLVSLLNAGALPAPVNLISQQTISATLGTGSLYKAIFAGLVGAFSVIVFMAVYYRLFGFFAATALLIYIALTLAVFKLVPITLTLSGIAGFILSIGMAVDANILIFERTKEEFAKGLSRIAAIEEGFRRAWPSIRDSNITTIISSVILYYYTTSFVRGFALALLIGVLVSMFSAITVTRTLLRVFVKNKQNYV